MKKTKILLPILSVAGLSAAVTPLVMLTSCNNSKTIPMSNYRVDDVSGFGISGNFNKGTKYSFTADLSQWTEDFGKPKDEATWKTLEGIYLMIKLPTGTQLLNPTSVTMSVGSTTISEGNGYEYKYESKNTHVYRIKLTDGSPIGYKSFVTVNNVNFDSKVENGAVYFTTSNI